MHCKITCKWYFLVKHLYLWEIDSLWLLWKSCQCKTKGTLWFQSFGVHLATFTALDIVRIDKNSLWKYLKNMTSVYGSHKNGERRWRREKQTKHFSRKTRAQESSTDFGRVQEKSHGLNRDWVWEEFQGFTKSSVWGVRPVKICGLWHSGRWLKESWCNLHFCQWLNWGAIEKATTDRLTLSSKINS